jgi:hypothetical protein
MTELWLARDENNILHLFSSKPVRYSYGTFYVKNSDKSDTFYIEDDLTYEWAGSACVELPDDSFPEVTWENSPKKLILE